VHEPADAILLRIFVGEHDRYERQPLYRAIFDRALAMGMAGATVLHVPQGFGQSRRMHTDLYADAQPRSPVIVEIVDGEAEIERFLPLLDGMLGSGLVTLERVKAIRYRREAAGR
jgi:uncharacterized protein